MSVLRKKQNRQHSSVDNTVVTAKILKYKLCILKYKHGSVSVEHCGIMQERANLPRQSTWFVLKIRTVCMVVCMVVCKVVCKNGRSRR